MHVSKQWICLSLHHQSHKMVGDCEELSGTVVFTYSTTFSVNMPLQLLTRTRSWVRGYKLRSSKHEKPEQFHVKGKKYRTVVVCLTIVYDILIAYLHLLEYLISNGNTLLNIWGFIFFIFYFYQKQTWSVIGKLPFRVKTALAGFWDGWLYFTSGQRDRGPDNPQPRKVIGDMWRTKLSLWSLLSHQTTFKLIIVFPSFLARVLLIFIGPGHIETMIIFWLHNFALPVARPDNCLCITWFKQYYLVKT